jgi:hypothetical protein
MSAQKLAAGIIKCIVAEDVSTALAPWPRYKETSDMPKQHVNVPCTAKMRRLQCEKPSPTVERPIAC